MRSLPLAIVVAGLVASAATPAAAADVVKLTDGRVLEGKIIRQEKGWIGLETADGVVWLEPKMIASYSRDKAQPAPAKDDPPAREGDEPSPATDADSGDDRPARDEVRSEEAGADGKASAAPPASSDASVDAEADGAVDRMVAALGHEDRARRVAAAEWVVESWPEWKPAVVAALGSGNEAARVEAVRLLGNRQIRRGVTELLTLAVDDKSALVRVAALRTARLRKRTGLETAAIRLMRFDREWSVRQEAIRTLEDIGSEKTLPHVFSEWTRENDAERKRRYVRVMVRLLGTDFGDDTDAWANALTEVRMGTRKLRSRR